IVPSERSDASACRLFLTRRAAKPAVAAPSTNRARASAARTRRSSSVESTLPITICITTPRGLAGIEHATAAIRQVFAGAARLVVAGMVQNKDVTGPAPDLIISIQHYAPCSRFSERAGGRIGARGGHLQW